MLKLLQQIQDFDYFPCPKPNHELSPLNLICADSNCMDRCLLCIYCQQQNHSQHLVLPLKQYIKKLIIATKADLESQNILLLAANMEKARDDSIAYLENLKNNMRDQIDKIISQIKLQYQKYGTKIKQICCLRKHMQNVIKMHSSRNTEDKQSQSNKKQQTKIQDDQANTDRQDIDFDLNKINARISIILKYATLEENYNQFQNLDDDLQKTYSISSLPNQIKILCQSFKGRWDRIQKLMKKSQEQFETKTCVKAFEIFHENIQTLSSFKKSKFKWTQTYKSNTFAFNGNKVERISAGGEQRFVFFNQELLPYIKKKQKVAWILRISKLAGWIGIGVCLKQKIIQNGFKFKYDTLGHGSYLISSNGYSWSSIQSTSNSTYHGFNYAAGDYVIVEFECSDSWKLNFYICKENVLLSKAVLKTGFSNKGSNTTKLVISQKSLSKGSIAISDSTNPYYIIDVGNLQKSHTLTLEQNSDYIPCVNLCSLGDGVEIIE